MFRKATDIYIKNLDYGFIIEPLDFVLPKLLKDGLSGKGFTNEQISDLTAIADTSFNNRENQDLIRLALKGSARDGLTNHSWKYRWLRSSHMGKVQIPVSDFKERLHELMKIKRANLLTKLKDLKSFENETISKKKKILAGRTLDAHTLHLLEVAELAAPWHDRRKEIFLRSIYTIDSCRHEIAARLGYTKELLVSFDCDTICGLADGKKINREYAEKLGEAALVYYNGKNQKIYLSKDARRKLSEEIAEDFSGVDQIKGVVACMGNAKGRVRIIQGTDDMTSMQKGDVLVSSMTRPEIVAAIEKAAAIVTDEGGITCHAAIVSRELGIPCVIGTRIATRVLKDGDYVEVDAVNGVVKKIVT